VAVVQEA
jgi:putative transposase